MKRPSSLVLVTALLLLAPASPALPQVKPPKDSPTHREILLQDEAGATLVHVVGKATAAGEYRIHTELADSPPVDFRFRLSGRDFEVRAPHEKQVRTGRLGADLTDPLGLVVLLQATLAWRYLPAFQAAAAAIAARGTPDQEGYRRQVAIARTLPFADEGICALQHEPVLAYSLEQCPPPYDGNVSVNSECYGAAHGQDFECSAGAPEETYFYGERVDFHHCCLEHDRAFWCGGTSLDGANPFGAGSWRAWETANARLLSCVQAELTRAYAEVLSDIPWWAHLFTLGTIDAEIVASYDIIFSFWTLYWSVPGIPFAWWNPHGAGDGWNNLDDPFNPHPQWEIDERARQVAARQNACLCGGSQPVRLCEDPCRINTCDGEPPDVLEKDAFVRDESACPPQGECLWICEEETTDGVPTSRHLRTYFRYASGQGLFMDCVPSYPPCDCPEIEKQPAGPTTCDVPLPGGGIVSLPAKQGSTVIEPGLLIPVPRPDPPPPVPPGLH